MRRSLSMVRMFSAFIAVTVTLSLAHPPPAAQGATKCTSDTKCAVHKKQPATKGRSEYSATERAKMMERARKICRSHEGAPSTVYRIDYKRQLVYCTPAFF